MNNRFLKQLKEQTDTLHKQAHHLEYFKVMFHHFLPIESYLGQLRALSIIYGALEREIENSSLEFPKGYVKKLPLLLEDIAFVQESYKGNIASIKAALLAADNIMTLSVQNPIALLGYLYTLEGSLQGGNVVAPHIIEQYKIEQNKGVSYFFAYGENLKTYWEEFKPYLENLAIDNEEIIIQTSKECFQSLIDIYSSLYPYKESQNNYHSSLFNPEAGEHTVPTDPQEIEASIKACKECWYYFPYFELRYGERGYRFGISDTLWLLTLNNLSQEEGKVQIEWITKYLANKGMPSIIMEKQLYFLYSNLEQKEEYTNIKLLYEHLENSRFSLINKNEFDNLSKQIESNIDLEWSRKLKNLGDLTISALIDKELNYTESMEVFVNWFCDEKTFPQEFTKQFKKAYQRLESQLQERIKNG